MGFQFSRTGDIGGKEKIGLTRSPAVGFSYVWHSDTLGTAYIYKLAAYTGSPQSIYKTDQNGSVISSIATPSNNPRGVGIKTF